MSEPSSPVHLVARRELGAGLRARSFVAGTVVSLVLLMGFLLVRTTVFDDEDVLGVGLNGQSIAVAGPLTESAAQLGLRVRTSEVTELAVGRQQVEDGSLDVLVSGTPAALHVLVGGDLDPELHDVLNRIVQRQVLNGLLASVEDLDAGDVQATMAQAHVEVRSIEPAGARHDQHLALALIAVTLLHVFLLLYGSAIAHGVVEEKANRVVELLVTRVRPEQLLAGKVVGLGLVGVVQLAVVGGVGLLLAVPTGLVAIPGAAAATLAWALVWFLLGHLLYATVFAAAGSLVSRPRDVPVVLVPVTAVLVAALVLGFVVLSGNPSGPLATTLSLLPPLSPLLMPGRIALDAVPLWQMGVAVALTAVAVVPLARLCAVVHRNSALHIGPRRRLRDALR